MRGTWWREAGGWALAALIAAVTTAQLASTARSELLLRDGDSLVVALLVRSVGDGEPFEWAMSTVLFIPEIVVFAVLWLVGTALSLEVNALLVLNGIVNIVALYGAIRFAAGRRRTRRAPVGWSVVALLAICLIATTETSASRDALELASLITTTTYYAGTVIAVLLSAGLVRRAFDHDSAGRRLPIWLGIVALVSVLSNPLYIGWAAVPLGAILLVAAVYPGARRRALPLLWALSAGSVLGLLARIPLSAWIANDGTGYAQPAMWPESVRYYGDLLALRLSTPLGWAGCLLLVALFVFAVLRSVRADDAGARVLAISAWVVPLVVVIGMVVLGTHAARYLQPVVFLPALALVASPRALRVPRRAALWATAAASVALVVAAGLSVPRMVPATRPSADLRCVDDWVSASGRVGAGQFWTVRLPKLHLSDASQLVQVDHQLNAYAWLTNRADFRTREVTFLIEDAQSTPWSLGVDDLPIDAIACGQYTIYDFGTRALPLGPPRS